MNRSSKNFTDPRSADPQVDPQLQSDRKIDAALQALNSVQPAARFEQRVHARLAQAQEAAAAGSAWSNSFEKLAGVFTWPRAAFALATFTAGVVAATVGLPLLHRSPVEPATSHQLMTPPASTPTNSAGAVAAEPATVHPGFTVRTPDGRAAALNTLGTVATVRSRNAHSDTQLAANRQDHVHARLAKPLRPRAGTAAQSVDQPAPSADSPAPAAPSTDRNSPQ